MKEGVALGKVERAIVGLVGSALTLLFTYLSFYEGYQPVTWHTDPDIIFMGVVVLFGLLLVGCSVLEED